METIWKWHVGGWFDACKARERIQYKYQAISCFGDNSTWLPLVILASNIWWWTWLCVSVADRLVSSQVAHGLPSFASSGFYRSIERQQNVQEHLAVLQSHWQWRSQGLVLGTGSVATKRNQGFVSVVCETCETLVLLDGCSGVRPLDLSKRVTEMGWKQDESGTGEIVLIPVKLEKESNTSVKQYLVLAQIHANSPWLPLVILASNIWWWTWLCVSAADRLVSSQGFTWFAIVFVHRPLPKHWKSTKPLRASTWEAMKLARKEPRPGAWHRGLVPPGFETEK